MCILYFVDAIVSFWHLIYKLGIDFLIGVGQRGEPSELYAVDNLFHTKLATFFLLLTEIKFACRINSCEVFCGCAILMVVF